MGELRFYLTQSLALLCSALEIGDVNIGADIACELSTRVSGNSTLYDPAIFSIRSPEAIFHPERLSGVECRQEDIEASLQIVWIYAFRPSTADFLLHRSASEFKPRFVEIIAEGIRSGHPNQNRRSVGHDLEPGFALK